METPLPAKQTRKTPSRDADAEFGARAHDRMWRAHLTQTRLANAMSIDSTSLGKKLRGERGWALQEMIDAAAALKTTIAYLAGETEDPEPPRPGDRVGPAGLEPTTSTVEQSTIATVHSLAEARSRKAHTQSMATTAS